MRHCLSFFTWETQSHSCNLGCLELSMRPSASPLQCCVCHHTQKDPIVEKKKDPISEKQTNKPTNLFLHPSFRLRPGANSFCACQLRQPLSPVCQWGSGPGWGGVASVMFKECHWKGAPCLWLWGWNGMGRPVETISL